MKRMELKLCFATPLMSSTLLPFFVSESFVGKVLDLNTNLLLLEMAEEFARCSESIIRLHFAVCLQLSIGKLKIVFFACELTTLSLKERPEKTHNRRILFQALFGERSSA